MSELIGAAALAARMGRVDLLDDTIGRLVERPREPLASELRSSIAAALCRLWDHGWQPADVPRVFSKHLSGTEARLVSAVIVEEAATYALLGERVAPRWMRQVDELAGARWRSFEHPTLPWFDVLVAGIRALDLLQRLPSLPVLEPPPSGWHAGMATRRATEASDGILEKVRAMLAKAESTQFEAEAEAFTAKAQQLMTRHRIDRAVLDAGGQAGDGPTGRRLGIDDPYADAKAGLLAAICTANGAQAVWSKHAGFSTVFAFELELDIIEELFTSLLVQASAALRREGSKQDRYGRSRTTKFRRSFLAAFAHRIGQRLQETAEATVSDAEQSVDGLLPVLAAREAEVADAAIRAFPETNTFSPAASDGEGWFAGLQFAETADLSVGPAVEDRAAS